MSRSIEYLYHVKTWGGFYNDGFREQHQLLAGDFYFKSEAERTAFINERKGIKLDLNTPPAMFHATEGYHCNTPVTLHRVTKYAGKDYYTTRKMFSDTSYENAVHFLKYKWYPGFNDYPLGDDFDYENEDFEIIQEWVSGCFTLENTEDFV